MIKREIIITIRRPNGEIEEVDVTAKFGGMNPGIFAQIKAATSNAGRGEALKWEERVTDLRSEAEKAYSEVMTAFAKAEAAENASYYDPARICAARNAADKAKADWAAKYPEAAKELARKENAEHAAATRRLRESDGYKAKLEGRD